MTAINQFSTNLCDCGKDYTSCCLTCWCPCITFGRIAEIVDKRDGSCGVHGFLYGILCLGGCNTIYSCMYRTKLREQYSLYGQSFNDCVVHCCCECCALCQEYRELKSQGFKPALGWEGNLGRQNGGVAMPPVARLEMRR